MVTVNSAPGPALLGMLRVALALDGTGGTGVAVGVAVDSGSVVAAVTDTSESGPGSGVMSSRPPWSSLNVPTRR